MKLLVIMLLLIASGSSYSNDIVNGLLNVLTYPLGRSSSSPTKDYGIKIIKYKESGCSQLHKELIDTEAKFNHQDIFFKATKMQADSIMYNNKNEVFYFYCDNPN